MVADILVELKSKQIDQTFTYKINEKDLDKIKVGIRVLVPFGKQKLEGFVLKIYQKNDFEFELKEIDSIVDINPVLNEEMLDLGKYISNKTLSNLITCYQTMLPSALKAKNGFTVNKKIITYLKLNSDFEPKTDKQKELKELFKQEKVTKVEANKISIYTVNKLIEQGIIIEQKEEIYRNNEEFEKIDNKVILNDEQKNVINNIELNNFKPYLLHGVTGSGKTEVYMNLIEKVIKEKEVIVLVPEISLTPQLVNIFKNRFGSNIAILHSQLNDGEKYDEWRKIERKEVKIVIGARSAIFAPFTNLGLIVIDEEHSNTYKQENEPKYNAIDIALYRAKKYNIPVILGSATPSIESYTRAKTDIYKLLEMKKRVNNNLPEVILIDMKDEIKKGNKVFSKILIDQINEKLNSNEQIILLLNRRGYSTITTCHECGYTDKCPNCDIPLIYHKNTNRMKCHYCNYEKPRITICPICKSDKLNDFGLGTEKLEQLINETFNKAKTIRMDLDTTRKKNSLENIINDFKNQKYNILIGTQMISKGLDFPNVTLVGVINGDASLNIPDFRSGERTFQLLNQVAGRSGRGTKQGKVIIQGFNMNHYSIIDASKHDYTAFYNEEMKIRKLLNYPPYYNLILIKISGKDYKMVNNESIKIGNYLNKTNKLMVLGPSNSFMPKINNTYFMQIIIKYKKKEEVNEYLKYIINQYRTNNKVKISVDINPYKL